MCPTRWFFEREDGGEEIKILLGWVWCLFKLFIMENFKHMQNLEKCLRNCWGPHLLQQPTTQNQSCPTLTPIPGCFEASPRHHRLHCTILDFVNNVEDYCQRVRPLSVAFPLHFDETKRWTSAQPIPRRPETWVSRPGQPGGGGR